MPTTKKAEIIDELSEQLKKARSFALIQYQGLTTPQLESLKGEMEKSNAKLTIAKNTLLNLALQKVKAAVPNSALKGPTALLLNYTDGTASLKSLLDFKKGLGRETPQVKLSFFDGQIYSEAKTLILASLPSREVLISRLNQLLEMPLKRLVLALKNDQRKLVFVLNMVRKKKR